MKENIDVVVIGGGQSGLSTSYLLKQAGVDHVVLDRGRPGDTWRKRWDSFCLVTLNKLCRLPDFPYTGDSPDGFMLRDEIVDYVERFAASFDPPLRSGVEVTGLRADDDRDTTSRFVVRTEDGDEIAARHVIVATGTYQHPRLPSFASTKADDVHAIHTCAYTNSTALPDGAVMIVGSGQSGCQIAEDLIANGRTVHLATGTAGRIPRRYRGRDLLDWALPIGFFDMPAQQHPAWPHQRFAPNPHVSGRDGGRTIDLRALGQNGVHLYGRLTDLDGYRAHFANDLQSNLDKADAFCQQMTQMIDGYIEREGIDAPAPDLEVIDWHPRDTPTTLDLRAANISSIIWATGYNWNFSWIDLPVFDDRGYPRYERGVTEEPGLYFVGLHWLHTWGSALFYGVARDAQFLVDHITSSS